MQPSAPCSLIAIALAVLCAPSAAQGPSATNRAWAVTLGGSGYDWPQTLAAHSDGGAFVAGLTTSFGSGDEDLWVTRLDRRGVALWETAVGSSGYQQALTVLETSEGGCVVGGSFPGAWLVQLDWKGDIFWQKTYGPISGAISSIAQAPDGGYYLGGLISNSSGTGDVWVAKVGMWGNVEWQEFFDGGGAYSFYPSITATEQGLALVASTNASFAGAGVRGVQVTRPWVVSLDGDGHVLWQKTYTYSGSDVWTRIVALDDGGFIAAGQIHAAAYYRGDLWAVRLDADGNVEWDVRLGNPDIGYAGSFVSPTSDGGFALLGLVQSAQGGGSTLLFKLDAAGSLEWNRSYSPGPFGGPTTLDVSPNDGLFTAGVFTGAIGDLDAFVVRLAPNGQGPASCHLEQPTESTVWSGALAVDDVSLEPTPASLVEQDTSASAASAASTTYLCPPGVPISGDRSSRTRH